MARYHSGNMADQGYPAHAAQGFNTQERYERFGLAQRCRLPDPTESSIRTGQELETIERVRPGTTDEGDIGRRIVENWIDDDDDRRKLRYDATELTGIGVEVTEDGSVYATMNLC